MISVWSILVVIGVVTLVFSISSFYIASLTDVFWIFGRVKRFVIITGTTSAITLFIIIFLCVKYTNADIEKVTEFEISAEYNDRSDTKVKFVVTLPNGETDTYKNNDSFTDISYVEKRTVLGKDFYELYLTKFDYASLCETIKLQSDTIKIIN